MAIADKIMRYEQGEMTSQEERTFFQELIDTGLAWQLQGRYGGRAWSYIKAGLCEPRER